MPHLPPSPQEPHPLERLLADIPRYDAESVGELLWGTADYVVGYDWRANAYPGDSVEYFPHQVRRDDQEFLTLLDARTLGGREDGIDAELTFRHSVYVEVGQKLTGLAFMNNLARFDELYPKKSVDFMSSDIEIINCHGFFIDDQGHLIRCLYTCVEPVNEEDTFWVLEGIDPTDIRCLIKRGQADMLGKMQISKLGDVDMIMASIALEAFSAPEAYHMQLGEIAAKGAIK